VKVPEPLKVGRSSLILRPSQSVVVLTSAVDADVPKLTWRVIVPVVLLTE
jgi:hypothetical protein